MKYLFIAIGFLALAYSAWFVEWLLGKQRNGKWAAYGILAIAVALLATLPLYSTSYTPILMTSIIMYIILSVSWTMFSGPTGYMSLATAAFFGVGIYTAAFLGNTVPLAVFIIVGGLISSGLAVLVGALTLRLRGIYFAIFTFGLILLISNLLIFWELHMYGTRGRFVVVIDYNTIYYAMFVVFLVLMIVVYFINRSRYGLALQSIGQYEDAAAHMGINVTMVKVVTFAISAFFAGAAGATIATRWTYIDPGISFSPLFSFLPVLMAIFGGMSRVYGPVIGAIIFAYLQEILITEFSDWYMLIFGVVLVVAILYMPDGLIGLVFKLINKWRKGGSAAQNANT